MAGILYFIGLVICSIALGDATTNTNGWALLGAGLILGAFVTFIQDTLGR